MRITLKENAPAGHGNVQHTKTNLESQTTRPVHAQAPVSANDNALSASISQLDSFAVDVGFGTVALVAAPIVGPAAVAVAGIGIAAGAVKSMFDTGNNLQAIQSNNQRRIIESDNSYGDTRRMPLCKRSGIRLMPVHSS
jgi:hypothetical protein